MKILSVGKIKNKSIKNLVDDYFERLNHYVSCSLVEIKDGLYPDQKIKQEEESLLKSIDAGDYVVLLDEHGQTFTSGQLAEWFEKHYQKAIRNHVFVIGGAFGVGDKIKKRANFVLSLSTLTLPHELARVLLFEQLYRAHTIIKREKYHH